MKLFAGILDKINCKQTAQYITNYKCKLTIFNIFRPISGSLIFDLFTPAGRGVANGVFSWGIYFGYALAYILGITAVDADILGHGWRSVYVMCSIPGFAIGISILLFLQDPKYQRLTSTNNSEVSTDSNIFLKKDA